MSTNSKRSLRRTLLCASILVSITSISVSAQAQTISGKVTDTTGQAPIQGAIITIDGLNRRATTDRFGEYRLTNVPEGIQTIVVSYLGADGVRTDVDVPADGMMVNLVVGEDVGYMDNLIVVGTKAATAGALNQQRSADSIMSVIDSDGLGNFPDTTVADSLQRVAGLSIETDQGEGRYVSIRGINTDLIAASINGVRTPSPEDRRGVLLDGVPSDLLDGIEIQKSLTPDVDGDSLGGVINLKTISAFERDGKFIRAKLEGRHNEITGNISPKGTLTYSNAFNDTFGLAISLNYQEVAIESHNNESGGWDESGGVFFMDDDYEQRWYDLTRERYGFVGNFDWRASDTTDIYLRTLFNHYKDNEVRNKFELRDLDDGGPTTATSSTVPLNEVDAEGRLRKETRDIQTISLGGKTQLDSWAFDYEVSYAYAEEDDSDNHDVTFRFEDVQNSFPGNIVFDTSTPETPTFTGPANIISAIYDPANYNLDSFEQELSKNEDTEIAVKFNISKDALFMDNPVAWKAGFKYRDREKIRDENFVYYEDSRINAANFTADRLIDDWRLTNDMPAWPDANLTRALRGTFAPGDLQAEDSFFDSNAADYVINEDILAAYAMGTLDIGNARIVAGVRVENSNVDLQGNIVTEDNLVVDQVRNVTMEYTDVLPSFNVRYDFSDKVIGRAAYYAAIVRPAFGDMAPTVVFDDNREQIEAGNPGLNPYSADNFDLSLEFYPSSLSVISVGLFYKDIRDAIFPVTIERPDDSNGNPIPLDQYLAMVPTDLSFFTSTDLQDIEEVSTYINADNSHVAGVEFNYVQELNFISEALEGFLLSANLTLTDSKSTIPFNGGTREVPLIKQSDTVWNVALGYDKGPWDLRVSANYRADYVDVLEGPELDRYTNDRLLVEASAKYKVNDNLQLYVEGKNLTDEPEYYYFGDTSRLSQYDEFGTTFIFGARLTY